MILLDTHVVAWLAAGVVERIPGRVRDRLAGAALRVSPMAALELTYLHEVGRLREPADTLLGDLRRRIGLEVAEVGFSEVAGVAAGLGWTRDPFDRLIAAHAIVAQAPLVTADATIRAHVDLAVWD